MFSETDERLYRCPKAAETRSNAGKRRYQRLGGKYILFANTVGGCWNTTQALRLVVFDIGLKRLGGGALLLNAFDGDDCRSGASQKGSNKPYYYCLEKADRLKRRTDMLEGFVHRPGSVYSYRVLNFHE